ncbi:hypothetical protein JHK87_007018 [Glycine soja]|nr:hypothetical protein JHK87_007018 [Glycine soja]
MKDFLATIELSSTFQSEIAKLRHDDFNVGEGDKNHHPKKTTKHKEEKREAVFSPLLFYIRLHKHFERDS